MASIRKFQKFSLHESKAHLAVRIPVSQVESRLETSVSARINSLFKFPVSRDCDASFGEFRCRLTLSPSTECDCLII
jgi:hypothetical protein